MGKNLDRYFSQKDIEMASKQIKMLLAIEDIKTTIRYHFITTTMAKIKKSRQ